MLSDFQRKNPNRAISDRNYQTYLERALEEARLDELDIYWKDGVIESIFKRKPSLFKSLAIGLQVASYDILKQEKVKKLLEYWKKLESSIPLEKFKEVLDISLFNLRLSFKNKILLDFSLYLISKGASPFETFYGSDHNALLNIINPLFYTDIALKSESVTQEFIEKETIEISQKWLSALVEPQTHSSKMNKILDTLVWRILNHAKSVPIKENLLNWIKVALKGAEVFDERESSAFSRLLRFNEYNFDKKDKEDIRFSLLTEFLKSEGSDVLKNPNFFEHLIPFGFGPEIAQELIKKNHMPWRFTNDYEFDSSSRIKKTVFSSFLNKVPPNLEVNLTKWLRVFEKASKVSPPTEDWIQTTLKDWMLIQFKMLKKIKIPSQKKVWRESLANQWGSWIKIGGWEDHLPSYFSKVIVNAEYLITKEEPPFPHFKMYDLLEPGLPHLLKIKNTPDVLFGKELNFKSKWYHQESFKIWVSFLCDSKNDDKVSELIESSETQYLKNFFWPAYSYSKIFKSTNFPLGIDKIEEWLKIYPDGQFFENDVLNSLLDLHHHQSYDHLLKAFELGHTFKNQNLNQGDFWEKIINSTLKPPPSSKNSFFHDLTPLLEKMKKAGFYLDGVEKSPEKSPLYMAIHSYGGDIFIEPLLKLGADPLCVEIPENPPYPSDEILKLKALQEKVLLEKIQSSSNSNKPIKVRL